MCKTQIWMYKNAEVTSGDKDILLQDNFNLQPNLFKVADREHYRYTDKRIGLSVGGGYLS